METLHFRARVRDRSIDLREMALARRVWDGLRRAFPVVLAVLMMPDHLHLLIEAMEEARERERLRRALSRATFGRGERIWVPVEPARVVPDRLHRKRTVRYILLNPCRRGLVRDPAEWLWSTYRDVMGAATDPWVTGEKLAPLVGLPRTRFEPRFHEYVSSDPSVAVAGTPPPRPAPPSEFPEQSLDELVAATAAALRQPVAAITRRGPARQLFVGLAGRQGWWRADVIAERCGVSPSAVRRIWARGLVPELEAGALCLGDARLRAGFGVARVNTH